MKVLLLSVTKTSNYGLISFFMLFVTINKKRFFLLYKINLTSDRAAVIIFKVPPYKCFLILVIKSTDLKNNPE
jgi:hypothetical protein